MPSDTPKFQLIVQWSKVGDWGVEAEVICASRAEARELAIQFLGNDNPEEYVRAAHIYEGWLIRLGREWIFETNTDVNVEIISGT